MVMTLYEKFNDLLQILKSCDRNKQDFILKKIISSVQFSNKEDLQELLHFINTIHDMELQVKLFSILSVHLLNNGTNIDAIVTFNPIYDAIERILSKNLPLKSTVALNFLTILLQSDSIGNCTSRKSLYMHAQTQIRVSGCLANMADIFTSGMTYYETWKALCQCLAETCNNSERNQNYCTHLIPKCVKRFHQRNMETFPVLQSLIYNNKRNAQLFLECDGMSLFKRELLQYESSLQLLNAVVQTSTEATIMAQNTRILQYVHDLLRLCGPYTPTGQWATVILYHADIKIKGFEEEQNRNIPNNVDKSRVTEATQNVQMDDDDTMLFRNVIKEIVQWHAKEEDIYNHNVFGTNKIKNKRQCQDILSCNIDLDHINEKLRSPSNKYNSRIDGEYGRPQRLQSMDELSFSFLSKNFKKTNKQEPNNKDEVTKNKYDFTRNATKTSNINLTKSQISMRQISSHLDVTKFFYKIRDDVSVLDLNEFKPNFVSTPKHKKCNNENRVKHLNNTISANSNKTNGIKKKSHPEPRRKLVENKPEQRSFKARIFSAINNSCTVLMNSVTGIFKPRNSNQSLKVSNYKTKCDDEKCSYSFTDYMRQRDAVVFEGENVNQNIEQTFSFEPDSCRSCDNTYVLKVKMLNDNFLKETVKKLKIGINMYGCNFKKISKAMWPHETYMTPAILYNLYRKLIIK